MSVLFVVGVLFLSGMKRGTCAPFVACASLAVDAPRRMPGFASLLLVTLTVFEFETKWFVWRSVRLPPVSMVFRRANEEGVLCLFPCAFLVLYEA